MLAKFDESILRRVPLLNLLRPPQVEQRAEPRYTCSEGQRATLFLRAGGSYAARVGNISASGVMLKVAARPLVDDRVVVEFEGCAPLHATVRWAKDGCVGLQFGEGLRLA
ncbi:MAG: PilZ domain-containing protein [Allosphingosinicella sp.]|uniref:PilZ domain-containing protein n=1 Tax=Allosphingosinicella sp. TaxID=2823234 RepID=UPI0039413F4F